MPVPRHAPLVHRRGGLRAPPPGRPLGRAVAGAAWTWARTSASGRTASRRCSGCGSRRATSSSAWTPSSTRRRGGSGMDWAVRMEKPRFIGRAALERTAKLPDQRRLRRLHDGRARRRPRAAPISVERRGRRPRDAGAGTRPLLGQAVMLGWQKRTPFADRVEIDGREARRQPDAVLRPGGPPCPRLSRCAACGSSPIPARHRRARAGAAMTAVTVLRLAPDDALRHRRRRASSVDDEHAIVEPRARLRRRVAAALDGPSARHIEWPLADASARPSPRARSPACRRSCGCPTTARRCVARDAPRPTPTSSPEPAVPMSDYTETLLADPLGGRRRSRPTTSSSSAAAGTASRPPTTSRPATASRTWPSSRPTTSRRATPAATRPSSAPTTASPRRSASTSTRSSCTRSSRTRPAPRSSTRPRASSGWPTPRWRCAPSARAAS